MIQAQRIGLSRGQILHRRESKEWLMARPGVLRLAGAPVTWESEVIASALLLGDRAVASHTTASRLLGLRGTWAKAPEFTVRPGRRVDARGQTVHKTRMLGAVDLATVPREVCVEPGLAGVGVVREFRVTSAARTIIDLAGRVTADELGNLVDDAASRGLASGDYLRRRLYALGGKGVAGTRMLAEVLLDAGGHSWLERRFLRLVREAGLPRPRTQVVFKRGTARVARVDFLFEGTTVIVEVSGRRGHSSDADRGKDARRRNHLQEQGYTVLEFLTTDVIDDPEYVQAVLLRELGRTLPA